MPAKKIISFDDGEISARIEVHRAGLVHLFVHDQAIDEALADELPVVFAGDLERLHASAMRTFRIVSWPVLLAATTSAVIKDDGKTLTWPLPVDVIAALPADMLNEWQTAALELNPSWIMSRQFEAGDPKAGESGAPSEAPQSELPPTA